MRGQTAIELLLLLAMTLLILIPFIYNSYISSTSQSRMLQAQTAVGDIARAADYVYAQGFGSQATLTVLLPGGVDYSNSFIGAPSGQGQELSLRLQTSSGTTDVYQPTRGTVTGFWPNQSGLFRFTLYASSNGNVVISPYAVEFIVSPGSFSAALQPTNSTGLNVTVTGLVNSAINISLSTGGDVSSWITLNQSTLNVSALGTAQFSATITVPSGTSVGDSTGIIAVKSNNTVQQIPITITVFTTGNITGVSCNASYMQIQTFGDSAYTVPKYIFDLGENVSITGGNWTASSTVTVDLKDPLSVSVSGYPKVLATNSSGYFTDTFNVGGATTGTYTYSATQAMVTKTTTFSVIAC